MITLSIFWALVLVLFRTSDDSAHEGPVGKQRRAEMF
jgi:hypothetical protein